MRGDGATPRGAKTKDDKDTKWPVVWCKEHVYLFARDENEDVEDTICLWGVSNPLAIYTRGHAVRRFRKNYDPFMHAGDTPRYICKSGQIGIQ